MGYFHHTLPARLWGVCVPARRHGLQEVRLRHYHSRTRPRCRWLQLGVNEPVHPAHFMLPRGLYLGGMDFGPGWLGFQRPELDKAVHHTGVSGWPILTGKGTSSSMMGDMAFAGEMNTQRGVYTTSTWTSGGDGVTVLFRHPRLSVNSVYVKELRRAVRSLRRCGAGASTSVKPVHTTGFGHGRGRLCVEVGGRPAGPVPTLRSASRAIMFTTVNDPLYRYTQTWNNAAIPSRPTSRTSPTRQHGDSVP